MIPMQSQFYFWQKTTLNIVIIEQGFLLVIYSNGYETCTLKCWVMIIGHPTCLTPNFKFEIVSVLRHTVCLCVCHTAEKHAHFTTAVNYSIILFITFTEANLIYFFTTIAIRYVNILLITWVSVINFLDILWG